MPPRPDRHEAPPHSAPAPGPAWSRELLAGGVAAVVTLALLLSLGTLAMAPTGSQAAQLGATAALLTSALSAAVYALTGASRLPAGAPSVTSTLMVAGLLTTVLTSPALPAQPAARLAWGLAAVALSVVTMGLLQLAVAALGWAELVRKVPQAVLAGFTNAVALLVLLAQFQPLVGFSPAALLSGGAGVLAAVRPGSLAIGLGVAVLIWGLLARRPRWPAALLGLLSGTAAYHAASHWLPAVDLGPVVGRIPLELPLAAAWSMLLQPTGTALATLVQTHWLAIIGTGAAMAAVGALDSLVVVMSLDQRTGQRTSTRRELASIGLANLVGGLFGALPMGTGRSRTMALAQAGGASWRAAFGVALASAVLLVAGSPLLKWLPEAVLAGVMLTVAWALMDPWSRGLLAKLADGERSPALWQSIAVVAGVMVTTVWQGPLFGVALGTALAAVIFIRQLSRSALRGRYSAAQRPSRRIYPPALEARLALQRARITVLELEGTLFFGNAEQLAPLSETLPAASCALVLDLRRVTAIDESAALLLAQLRQTLDRRGIRLMLAHVQNGQPLGRRMALFGCTGRDGLDWFTDADHAVEAAEQHLLQTLPAQPDDGVPALVNPLLQGLDAAELAAVQAALQPCRVVAGQAVFRHGDRADAMYLVVSGSIRIVAPGTGSRPGPRYASLAPGTLFGEAAVLDGGGRTADALADVDTELLRLDQDTLDALARADPALAGRLYRNLAAYLARRLRIASTAWTAAAS